MKITKGKFLSTLGALFIFAITSLWGAGNVHAATQDITISPTSANVVLDPGSTNKGSFQVINQGKTGYDFQVYAAPYSVNGEDYTPDFTILPNAPNVADWFQFSVSNAHLDPGQALNVNYTVSVPAATLPGGYYGVAFAETKFPKSEKGVTLNERVGEIFYMQVSGPAVEKGSLKSWVVKLFQKPPLIATMELENDGAVHYITNVKVTIKDIFGNTKYSLDTQKAVLPQTVRRISVNWAKTPSFGLFKISGSVTILNKLQSLPSKYIVVMSPTVRFWLVVGVIVIILGLIGGWLIRKSRHKKHGLKTKD